MRRVILVHQWGGTPKSDWYQSVSKTLQDRKFNVEILEMPNTAEPEINAWVSHLSKIVGKINEDTYFIGHSIGCQTVMRYLEKLKSKIKIGGCVFVAGWFKLDNLENQEVKRIAKPWLETPIDFSKIKKHANKFTVILSSNDHYNFVDENARIFKEKLGAKVIVEKDRGHFTAEDGVVENKRAVDELLKLGGVK